MASFSNSSPSGDAAPSGREREVGDGWETRSFDQPSGKASTGATSLGSSPMEVEEPFEKHRRGVVLRTSFASARRSPLDAEERSGFAFGESVGDRVIRDTAAPGGVSEPVSGYQQFSDYAEQQADAVTEGSTGDDVYSEESDEDYQLTAFDQTFGARGIVGKANASREGGNYESLGAESMGGGTQQRRASDKKEKEAHQMPTVAFFVHVCAFGVLPIALLTGALQSGFIFPAMYFAAFVAMCLAPRSWHGSTLARLPFVCQGALAPNFAVVVLSVIISAAQIITDIVHQVMCRNTRGGSMGEGVANLWILLGYPAGTAAGCDAGPSTDMLSTGLIFASAVVSIGGHVLAMDNTPSAAWAGLMSLSGVMSVLSTVATPEAILAGFTAAAVQTLNALMEVPLLIFVICVCFSLALPTYSDARMCLVATFGPRFKRVSLRLVQLYVLVVVTVIFIYKGRFVFDSEAGGATDTVKVVTGMSENSDMNTPLAIHLLALLCAAVVLRVNSTDDEGPMGVSASAEGGGGARSFKGRQMAALQLFYPWVRTLHTPVNLGLVLNILMLAPSALGMLWSAGWTCLVVFGYRQWLSIAFAALGLAHWATIFSFGFSTVTVSTQVMEDIGAISSSSGMSPTGLGVAIFVLVLWNLMGLRLNWQIGGGAEAIRLLSEEDGLGEFHSRAGVSYSFSAAATGTASSPNPASDASYPSATTGRKKRSRLSAPVALSTSDNAREREESLLGRGEPDTFEKSLSGDGSVESPKGGSPSSAPSIPLLVRFFRLVDGVADRVSVVLTRLRPYFIAVAFLALFIAAVMTVNALHCVFLILFSVVVVWQRCPPILWMIVIVYTVLLTHALYGYWAFGPTLVETLEVIGFIDETKSIANLLPYYAFSAIFIYQRRVGGATQSDFSALWQLFLGALENVGVMLVAIATTTLFAVVASYEGASLMGELYLFIFMWAASTIFYKSFECPPWYIVTVWSYIIQPLVGFMVTVVYIMTLLDASIRQRIDDALAGTRLNCQNIGLTGDADVKSRSVRTLWPKLAVMMLLIVLTRTWRSRMRAKDTRLLSMQMSSGSSSTQQQQQASRALMLLTIVSVITVKLQRLIAIYSQGLAVGILYLASAISFSDLSIPLSAMQGLYFLFALFASMFTRVRSSIVFWRLCQGVSGLWCIAIFTVQQPILQWEPSALEVYFGLFPQGLADSMWPYVGIHALVFASSALHCNIDNGELFAGSRESTVPLLPSKRSVSVMGRGASVVNNASAATVSGVVSLRSSSSLAAREGTGVASYDAPPRVASDADPPTVDASSSALDDGPSPSSGEPLSPTGTQGDSGKSTLADLIAPILQLGQASVNFMKSLDAKIQEPMAYFRRFGYYATLLCLIVTARVLYGCVLGPVYLLLSAVYGMMGKQRAISNYKWFILSVITCFLMVVVYGLRLGYPPDDDYVKGFITRHLGGAAQEYLVINPSEAQLWLTMMCWCVVTLQRRAIRSYRGSKPIVGALPVTGLTVADRLTRYAKEISAAREAGSKSDLMLYIPLPKESGSESGENLMTSRRLADRARLFMFRYFGAVLLVVAFVHAVYDTATTIDALKLASQLIVMAFFQNFHALPWVGFPYWKGYFRFHVVWMMSRMVIFIPGIPYNSAGVCAMKVCGLLPDDDLLPSYVTLPSTDCPGNKWTAGELAFHTVCVTLIWWQIVLIMKRDYAYVLHSLFDEESYAAQLGNTIRAFRLRAIHTSKQRQQERERERLATLRAMIETKGAMASLGEVEGGVASVDMNGSLAPSPTMGPAEGSIIGSPLRGGLLDGSVSAAEVVLLPPTEANANRRAYFDTLTAEHARVTRQIDSTLDEDARSSQQHQRDQNTVSNFSAVVDSRSLAVLAGVNSTSTNGRANRTASRPAYKQKRRAESKGIKAGFQRLWQFGREHIDDFILWLDRNSLGLGANPVTREALHREGRVSIFVTTLYRFLLSYTDRLAFLTFSLHFAIAPSLLTAVLPLSVFFYAAVVNPRPHRRYWQLALIYIELIIVTKTILKATLCSTSTGSSSGSGSSSGIGRPNEAYLASPIHGRTCVAECYLADMLISLVCLLFVVIHIAQLRRWGLYNDSELYIGHEEPATAASEVYFAVKDTVKNLGRKEVKVGGEYYNAGFAIELICFLFIFFAYYRLVGSSDNLVDSLRNSILPGNLAVILILLIAIIVIDRILYLMRTAYGKYAFNLILAVVYHVIMIWWFVTQTEFVYTYYRESTFDVRGTLYLAGILYMLKGLYLYLSAAQVCHGWHESVRHICFTGNYGTLESILYTISRLTPFVYDLRVVLDWTVTPSALKLNYWIKLEDIAHEVYLVLVDRQDTRDIEQLKKTAASPYPKIFKFPIGISFFGFLVAILVLPLLLYSSFSPVLETNSVESVRCTLSIDGVPSLWSSSNLKFAQGGSIVLNNTVVSLLQRNRPDLVGYDLTRNNPQLFVMGNYSNVMWSITPPAMSLLLQQLSNVDNTMTFSFVTEITNTAASLSNPVMSVTQRIAISPEVRGNLTRILVQREGSVKLPNLFLPFYFNKAGQQLTAIGEGTVDSNREACELYLSSNQGEQGFYFALACQSLFTRSTPMSADGWNTLSPQEWQCVNQDACLNVQLPEARDRFAIDSVFVLVTSSVVLNAGILQSIGIVAAYTTFVLAIGRVIRYALSGGAYRTTLEDMEDPQYLVCLIEFMMIIRGRKQYILEQQLYQELVNTIRDSSLLEQRTRYKQE